MTSFSHLNGAEEAAQLKLLKFMYSDTLSVNTAPALFDVLMAANILEVASILRHSAVCSDSCSHKFALLYLELHSSVLMAQAAVNRCC